MKKLLKIIWIPILCAVLAFTITDAITDNHYKKPIIERPSKIVCTCGCGQKAIQCGNTCPVARELLKKYKGV